MKKRLGEGNRMAREDWIWMPHPAHFILGHRCAFRLATYVPSGYIVSTVGELYYRDEGEAMQPLSGTGATYETMVFKAEPSGIECCPYQVADHSELDVLHYNSAGEARRGHIKTCLKYDSGIYKLRGKELYV